MKVIPQLFELLAVLAIVKFTRHITGPAAKLRYYCSIFFYIKKGPKYEDPRGNPPVYHLRFTALDA